MHCALWTFKQHGHCGKSTVARLVTVIPERRDSNSSTDNSREKW